MFQPSESRSSTCSFEFVNISNSASKINEEWVVLGAIEADSPEQNVISEEQKEVIQEDVCSLGGEAVGMWTSRQKSNGWYRTVYLVLKPRTGDEEGGEFNPENLPGLDV
jgi:hypothetical protein